MEAEIDDYLPCTLRTAAIDTFFISSNLIILYLHFSFPFFRLHHFFVFISFPNSSSSFLFGQWSKQDMQGLFGFLRSSFSSSTPERDSVSSGAPKPRLPSKSILILGETGGGKSTFINTITNYLSQFLLPSSRRPKDTATLKITCKTSQLAKLTAVLHILSRKMV